VPTTFKVPGTSNLFSYSFLFGRRCTDDTHEDNPTDDNAKISRKKSPQYRKNRNKMRRNQQGHKSGRAHLGEETGSRSWTEIDEKNQENLNGNYLEKVGIESHALENNIGHETLVQVEDKSKPEIVKECRLLILPEVDNVGLIVLDETVNLKREKLKSLGLFLPEPSKPKQYPLDTTPDGHGTE